MSEKFDGYRAVIPIKIKNFTHDVNKPFNAPFVGSLKCIPDWLTENYGSGEICSKRWGVRVRRSPLMKNGSMSPFRCMIYAEEPGTFKERIKRIKRKSLNSLKKDLDYV